MEKQYATKQLQARASLGRSKRVRIASEHSIATAAFMCGFLMLWKASGIESKAVTWHYFEIAMSQQLLENFISAAGTSSMWKKAAVIENALTYTLWVCSCALPLAFTAGCGRRQDIGLDGLTQRVSLMYLPLTAAKMQEVSWTLLAAEEW